MSNKTNFTLLFALLYHSSCLLNSYNAKLEQEIVDELSVYFTAHAVKQPMLILVGGFQGSGKSSLIAHIKTIFDVNVICTDSIRQSLFNRGIAVSADFSKSVDNVYKILIKKSLTNDANTVIDANAHAKRICAIENLLKEGKFKHRIIKILLQTSEEVLKIRVKNRKMIPGCYQGTEKDLEAALHSNRINFTDYDLIVDTDKVNECDVYKIVEDFLYNNFWR